MRLTGGIRRQLQWLGVIPALIMLVLVLVALTWQRFQDADNEVRQLGGFLAQQMAAGAEYGCSPAMSPTCAARRAWCWSARTCVTWPSWTKTASHCCASANPDDTGAVLAFHAGIYRQPALIGGGLDTADGEPDRIGEVVLGLSRGRILARQKEILVASLLPALLAVVVGLLIARYLARRIAEPVSHLSRLVRVIRGGDYQAAAPAPWKGSWRTCRPTSTTWPPAWNRPARTSRTPSPSCATPTARPSRPARPRATSWR